VSTLLFWRRRSFRKYFSLFELPSPLLVAPLIPIRGRAQTLDKIVLQCFPFSPQLSDDLTDLLPVYPICPIHETRSSRDRPHPSASGGPLLFSFSLRCSPPKALFFCSPVPWRGCGSKHPVISNQCHCPSISFPPLPSLKGRNETTLRAVTRESVALQVLSPTTRPLTLQPVRYGICRLIFPLVWRPQTLSL